METAAKESSLHCIVSSGLLQHHLFHLHVIKIEMYNLSPQTQAAVSWKTLCSPAWAGDGQEAGSWETSLGTVRIGVLPGSPTPSIHAHMCAMHTHTICTHAHAHTQYGCACTHMCIFLFFPKPGLNSQEPELQLCAWFKACHSGICRHLASFLA